MAVFDNIKRVAISYEGNKTDRIDYLFLAEFFRFTGIFVHEIARMENHTVEYKSIDYPIIWIGTNTSKETAEFEEEPEQKIEYQPIKINVLPNAGNNVFISLNLIEKKMLLTQLLDEIEQQWSYVTPNQAMIDIYVENNIMLHSLSLQYYPNRVSFAAGEAEKVFVSCYNEISKYIEGLDSAQKDYHMEYAHLWCAVKANNACKFQRQELYFSISDLKQQCMSLVNSYPEFNNARVLLGLCYEPANEYISECVNSLERALESEKENPYAASIAYWLGKRYEGYEANQKQAEARYNDAFKIKKSYRSYYKIACIEKKKENYEVAFNKFETLVEWLSLKKDYGIMDPIEADYMYKSLHHMADIAYQYMENCQQKVIWAGKKALELRGNLDNKTFFLYHDLYEQNDCKKYIEISKKRMKTNGICQMLANSFEALQEFELAKKYRDMIKG